MGKNEEIEEEIESEIVVHKDKVIKDLDAKLKLLKSNMLKKCEENGIIVKEKERVVEEFESTIKIIEGKVRKIVRIGRKGKRSLG